MTLVEVLVVIFVLVVLAAMLLPALTRPKYGSRINCVNNLKEIGLMYRVWEGDNDNKFPMQVSVTNGGAMESVLRGDAVLNYLVMSNELSIPKILVCPQDKGRTYATNFAGLTAKNISYFIGLDASDSHPQALLAGDDNFLIAGSPVKSGLLELSTNTAIAWSAERHNKVGNVVLADGSVQQLTTPGLQAALTQTSLATNRLIIP